MSRKIGVAVVRHSGHAATVAGEVGRRRVPVSRQKASSLPGPVDPLEVKVVGSVRSSKGNQRQSLGHLPRSDWFSCPGSSFLFCPHLTWGGGMSPGAKSQRRSFSELHGWDRSRVAGCAVHTVSATP